MIAVDFGTGASLAIYGPEGEISKKSLKLPIVKGGKSPRDEFRLILIALLDKDDVVVESATVGSSGCEIDDVIDIVSNSNNTLYTLTTRAVKNYRMDHGIKNPKSYGKYNTESNSSQEESHALDAEILYIIATKHAERLRKWHAPEPCVRQFTSVRPYDKRKYRGSVPEQIMSNLPKFNDLPSELQKTLGVYEGSGKNKRMAYSGKIAFPFAMAMNEPFIDDGPPEKARRRFEKLIGLYDHGYPSFYRRATVDWMQKVAKDDAGVSTFKDVTPEQRKVAWKKTQRQIRWLFHLSRSLNG